MGLRLSVCRRRAQHTEQHADNAVVEAVGPETLSFKEMVEHIRDAVGSPARLIHLPPSLVALCAKVVGWGLRDVLVTSDEVAGLMAELVTSDSPTTGRISFSEWVSKNGEGLGREYVSELERNIEEKVIKTALQSFRDGASVSEAVQTGWKAALPYLSSIMTRSSPFWPAQDSFAASSDPNEG
jgi:hypothetical protein